MHNVNNVNPTFSMQCNKIVPAYLSKTLLFIDPLTRIHGAIFNGNVFLGENKNDKFSILREETFRGNSQYLDCGNRLTSTSVPYSTAASLNRLVYLEKPFGVSLVDSDCGFSN